MIEEIINFLDEFFEAEKTLLLKYNKPNIEEYNNSVDQVAQFTVNELKDGFGAKVKTLRDSSVYKRVENYPAPDKRFLFRVDEYETSNKDTIYKCFISMANPDNWKKYHNCLLIKKQEGEFKIFSRFTWSDEGMGGEKKWYFGGGDTRSMHEVNGKYLLNEESLGKRITVNRILEPSNNEDSMEEYNKD